MNPEDYTADRPITVTQPSLPPLAEFLPYLEQIWASRILTNGGPMHQRLESALAEYLGVSHVALFCNGTIALVTALKALGIQGEVVTTPFTFVATAHALQWNGVRPVFVDIDPRTCNMRADLIEGAITGETRAILPVHCYGYPCDVDGIDAIASRHGLPVIYDAAHTFGVTHRGVSLSAAGDIAMLSFHATKVFSTFEGGALVIHDAGLKSRVERLRNFGFADETVVDAVGINGKMSEIQAAFGLLQLSKVRENIERNLRIAAQYSQGLAGVRGVSHLPQPAESVGNGSYYPIRVGPDYPMRRDQLYERLRQAGIRTRRYFYPLVSEMPMYRSLPSADPARLPNAHRVAEEILCLPIYPALSTDVVTRIVEIIQSP
ncbi:MAG: DegT/DnrJ/EryC1/StrS family aminotransferase [Betaproteobacteria bacterium]|nr:DegT/DnrJ/EryC1/StrS family aminotransferase [Betaproteobacteria bacterium]